MRKVPRFTHTTQFKPTGLVYAVYDNEEGKTLDEYSYLNDRSKAWFKAVELNDINDSW